MPIYDAYCAWAEQTSAPLAIRISDDVDRKPESQEAATWLWAELLRQSEAVGERGAAMANHLRELAFARHLPPWAVLRRRARQIESTHRTARGARSAATRRGDGREAMPTRDALKAIAGDAEAELEALLGITCAVAEASERLRQTWGTPALTGSVYSEGWVRNAIAAVQEAAERLPTSKEN